MLYHVFGAVDKTSFLVFQRIVKQAISSSSFAQMIPTVLPEYGRAPAPNSSTPLKDATYM